MGSIGGGALQAVGVKTQQLAVEVSDLKIMSFISDLTTVPVETNRLITNPVILAQWKITKPVGLMSPTNYRYVTGWRSVSGQIRRSAGTGFFNVAIVTSDDEGVTWNPQTTIAINTNSFLAFSDNDPTQQNIVDLTDFAVVAYGSIADTSGEFRELACIASIVIPSDFVLDRII